MQKLLPKFFPSYKSDRLAGHISLPSNATFLLINRPTTQISCQQPEVPWGPPALDMPVIVHPRVRRLHCQDPRVVANYIKSYEDLATKHNLPQKVQSLLLQASYHLTKNLQGAYGRWIPFSVKSQRKPKRNAGNSGWARWPFPQPCRKSTIKSPCTSC
jgi:hypothetical protein